MNLEEILKKLGWDDGFQIPIANAENKALEEQVAKLSLRKTRAKNERDRANSRLEGLKDHFKYVTQENDQNQKLITAHRQQSDALEHSFHLIVAERTNTQNDIKKMVTELEELDKIQEMKKSDLQKYIAKAEKVKTETEWDAEALKAWEETLKKRDDDIELIKKFSMDDARKYNDLEARRQLLQLDSEKKRKTLAKLLIDVKNNEMILDRTGKMLKQQEIEREALVKQWKEAVKMLQQRDDDVVKAQEQIIFTQELIEKQKEKLDEENGFLNNEQRSNHELDLEMEGLNALNSRMRRDINNFVQEILAMTSELQAQKREVASSAQHLENQRVRLKFTINSITQKEYSCVKFEEEIVKLNNKLEAMKGTTMNSAEKIRSLEKMIEKQEKLYSIYVADTEKINTHLYRNDMACKEQVDVGRTLEIELNNTVLFCTQLKKRINTERAELENFKEVVYNMEYRIDEFEKRLLALECESLEDTYLEEKEREISALEEALTDHKAVQHMLQTQVDRLREEMSRLNAAIALDKEQLRILQEKCEQHLLENEISKKHIAAAKRTTQEKQVEENMMRLRINQIEKDMKKEEKMIFSMERLRLNLDQAMRERQLEINTNKMILQAKRRSIDEDRGRLRGEIALRRVKIEQLQKKYHILLTSLGHDDEGHPMTVTNFRIKYAQEKYLLQQEGDELDKKIKTAEKEIIAMENTLKLVNLSNAAFKNSLAPVKEDDKEVQEMRVLEEEMMKRSSLIREARKTLTMKKQEIYDLEFSIKDKTMARDDLKEKVMELEEEIDTIEKQGAAKVEKLKRAECLVKTLLKKIGKRDISKYDRDFEIKLLRDGNRDVLERLRQLSVEYPVMENVIRQYLTEQKLTLPERKTTWSSSSSSLLLSSKSCQSSKQQVTPTSTSRSSSSGASEISLNKIELSLNI